MPRFAGPGRALMPTAGRTRRAPRSPALRGLGLALLLAGHSAGCSVWRPQPGPPAAPTPAAGPWRVVLRDGSSVVLSTLSVAGDSLSGEEASTARRRAIPRSAVARLERRERSVARALGLAWLTLGVLSLVAFVAFEAG